MALPAKRRASYQDVLDAPPHQVAEVVDGEFHASPRPAFGHGQATLELAGELRDPFGRGKGGPGGWIFLMEPELHLGRGAPDILVPDIAGWRRERVAAFDPEAPYTTISPDWVCEVLSPSTARLDRNKKLPAYARHGVPFCWLVDPLARTLEVFELAKDKVWRLTGAFADDAKVKARPFEAVALPLGSLWANLKFAKKRR